MNKPTHQNIKPMQNEQDKGTALPKQQMRQATKRRRRIKGRKLFLFGFVAWAAYVFFFVQIPTLHRLHQEQQSLSQSMQQAKQTNQDLQKQITKLQDPEYIGEIARKQYMLAKPGETIIVEPK